MELKSKISTSITTEKKNIPEISNGDSPKPRSSPDAIVGGEPYLALMLLLNIGTGRFFVRVWNKTTVTGRMLRMAEFSQVRKLGSV